MMGWNRQWRLAIAALAVFCVAALLMVFVAAATEKNIGPVGAIAMVLLAASVISAALVAGGQLKAGAKPAEHFSIRNISIVLLAIVGAFGVVSDFYDFLEPRAAVESTTSKIERTTDAILVAVSPDTVTAPILAAMPGRWGEPGCAIVYDISIAGEAVVLEEKAAAYRSVATIERVDGGKLTSVVTEPLKDRGAVTRWNYESNGMTEFLTMQDARSETPLRLDRCA